MPQNMGEIISRIFIEECGDMILPQHFGIYDEVNEGPYEDEYFFLDKNKESVVLDLGANIGVFPL